MTQQWRSLVQLCRDDESLRRYLDEAQRLDLGSWAIVGGVIRDSLWSSMERRTVMPKDIDLIFFDRNDTSKEREKQIERYLIDRIGHLCNVRNQARKSEHLESVAFSTLDEAMSFAPATISCIGITCSKLGEPNAFSIYGFEDLFQKYLRPTPRYIKRHSEKDFISYVERKLWMNKWPKARIVF